MPLNFDANGKMLFLDSSFDYNGSYTLSGWVRPVSASAGQGIFAVLYNAGTVWHNMDDLWFQTASKWVCRAVINSVGAAPTSGSYANGNWYHVAMVRSSPANLALYVNGVLTYTNTQDVTGRVAATKIIIGNGWDTTLYTRGYMGNVKVWNAALTVNELLNEMRVMQPLRKSNLWAWWPIIAGERYVDLSGNGRTLTPAGTLVDSVDIGVPWGGKQRRYWFGIAGITPPPPVIPTVPADSSPLVPLRDADGCVTGWAVVCVGLENVLGG
jgi:hypothetical protein